MISLTVCKTALFSALLTAAPILIAQTPDYHLEFSPGHHLEFPDPPRHIGMAFGHDAVVIVNDSEKPISIEALHFVQRCKGGGYWRSNDLFMNLRLTSKPIHQVSATVWPDAVEVEKKGRFDTDIPVETQADAKGIVEKCEVQMDAIFFSDGTYEGKEAAVRTLKAHRDGISRRVNYWAKRLNRENRDGSGIDALRSEAECSDSEDRAMVQGHESDFFLYEVEPVLESYSEGRRLVDSKVMDTLKAEEARPAEAFHQLSLQVAWWKEAVDSHPSTKKLDINFPPISDPIETCGPGFDKQ